MKKITNTFIIQADDSTATIGIVPTAKAGKPMVKVEAVASERQSMPPKRGMGALRGLFEVPEDFDTMGQLEIEDMFHNGRLFPDR